MTVLAWLLDSADLDLMQRWIADGSLPNIAALWKNSRVSALGGASWFDELGAWVTTYSGIPPTHHGYYGARRLVPGTYALEQVRITDAKAVPCWHQMHDPEFRALIWEPMDAAPAPHLAGTQIYNLTVHQEAFAADLPLTVPANYLQTIRRRLGPVPKLRFNRFGKQVSYYQAQLHENLAMVDRKSPILAGLVRDGRYDLIVIGFSEIHDAGHLLWPFMDGRAPDRDPKGQLSEAVHSIYQRIDREIGTVMELLPAGSTVCLLSAYGMVDLYPTIGLMESLMRLLGYQIPNEATARSTSLLGLARRAVPEALRFEISKHLPSDVQQGLLFSSFAGNTDFTRSRAFVLPTSIYTSHIRVNLKGREPAGMVFDGREYTALLDEMEADLMQLIDPVTGEPAIDRIVRSAGCLIEGPSLLIPDLFVHWKPARHFLDRAIHPRGEISQRKSGFHRESFHRLPGFAAISGPGIRPDHLREASLLDVAPTLLELMGAKSPAQMPGRSLCGS